MGDNIKRQIKVIVIFLLLLVCSVQEIYAQEGPNTVEGMMLSNAQKLLARGEPYEALKTYTQIIADWPDSKDSLDAYYNIPKIYHKLGMVKQSYEKALEAKWVIENFEYDETARIVDEYVKQATPLCFSGEYDKARELLNQIIEKYPDSLQAARAQNMVGCSYYHQKNYQKAIEGHQKAIQTYPDSQQSLKALRWIANMYFDDKRYDQALKVYQQVIDVYNNYKAISSWASIFLTAIDLDQSGNKEALKSLLESFGKESGLKDKTLGRGVSYLLQDKNSDAQKEFKKIITNYKNYEYQAIWSQYKKAEVYLKKLDYANAIIEYEQLIKDFPDSELVPIVSFEIGEAYYTNKDYKNAMDIFNKIAQDASFGELREKARNKINEIEEILRGKE